MRDKQLLFGAMALATKDTTVYSEDTLDMNTPATQYTGRMSNAVVVFKADAAFVAADSYIPVLMHSDDNDTFTEVARGAEVTAPAINATSVIPLPVSHMRYLKAGAIPKSSGTFTAKAMSAWIQLGA